MQKNSKPVKPVVLICYEYFFPGYKAGGPIQSLTNLIVTLQNNYTCKVVTGASDLLSPVNYTGININEWNQVILPGATEPIDVWYASNDNLSYKKWKDIFITIAPDFVYLNGIFTFKYIGLPLIARKFNKYAQTQFIICPRGMLQEGALSVKSFKKKLYLTFFKALGTFAGIKWHATTDDEKADIYKIVGSDNSIVAENIPKAPVNSVSYIDKAQDGIRLIYLSLITEKKNLLFLLQGLCIAKVNVLLDIYGPVKDAGYWDKCLAVIKQMPANARVVYHGDVEPAFTQMTIAKYHALVLLTKGENFGHALYESLSVGRPVITSRFTPWKELAAKQAGWTIDINTHEELLGLMNKIVSDDQEKWNIYCNASHKLACDYFSKQNRSAYNELFS